MPLDSVRSPEAAFARSLIKQTRRQSDQRIWRNVKEIEVGVVVSLSPLRIRPRTNATTNIVLEADDIAVVPDITMEEGQNVVLFRTKGGDFIVLSVVPGSDFLARDIGPRGAAPTAPVALGRQLGPLGDPPPTVHVSHSTSGTKGDRVIRQALSYIGVKEKPCGSNDGHDKIEEWIANGNNDQGPEPWCGDFAMAMYREANVDDQGIGNSYTGYITEKAVELDRLKKRPVKGCYVVNGTKHVMLYISGPLHRARVVGGNELDCGIVRSGLRDIRGFNYCVPEAIEVGFGSVGGIF